MQANNPVNAGWDEGTAARVGARRVPSLCKALKRLESHQLPPAKNLSFADWLHRNSESAQPAMRSTARQSVAVQDAPVLLGDSEDIHPLSTCRYLA